jgi:2-oxoglutarate dehydrogenase E2 component (dihydrolipoamide succinyltransferase)
MLRVLRVAGRRVVLRSSEPIVPVRALSTSHTLQVGALQVLVKVIHILNPTSCSHSIQVCKAVGSCQPKWQSQSAARTMRHLQTSAWRACSSRTVVVPQLAESISEGDIRWEKAVGDSVAADEVIGEIETDKTSIAINAPVAGVIEELLVEDGSTVRPGQQVVRIRISAEGASASPPSPQSASAPKKHEESSPLPVATSSAPTFTQPPTPPPVPSQPIATQSTAAFVAPSPAASTGTKIESGSFGVNARTEQRVKINRMRARISQRLKDAQNTYAMLTTFNEIDMTNAIEMRNLHKDAFAKRHNLKLGFMSAFVAASVHALKHQPIVNAVIDENEIVYRDYVDVSVAVATPKGLVVPVLRNCENMNFAQIEQNIAILGEKVRL